MPAEQPFRGQRLVEGVRRIEHHVDDPFHVPVHRRQTSDLHPHAAGNGGPHGLGIQRLALDLAGLHHVAGQRLQGGLLPEREPERLHPADQRPLQVPHLGEWTGQFGFVPPKIRPVRVFVDVHATSAPIAVNLPGFSADSIHLPHEMR